MNTPPGIPQVIPTSQFLQIQCIAVILFVVLKISLCGIQQCCSWYQNRAKPSRGLQPCCSARSLCRTPRNRRKTAGRRWISPFRWTKGEKPSVPGLSAGAPCPNSGEMVHGMMQCGECSSPCSCSPRRSRAAGAGQQGWFWAAKRTLFALDFVPVFCCNAPGRHSRERTDQSGELLIFLLAFYYPEKWRIFLFYF